MPTGILTASSGYMTLAQILIPILPKLIAPYLNIEGTKVHEGGVTADEIIIRLQEGTNFDCNAPDLNLFMRAHQFEGRVEQCQTHTTSIHDAIRIELDASGNENVSLSVEIIVCELGYASSNPRKGANHADC